MRLILKNTVKRFKVKKLKIPATEKPTSIVTFFGVKKQKNKLLMEPNTGWLGQESLQLDKFGIVSEEGSP